MIRLGILALQGCVRGHEALFDSLGQRTCRVVSVDTLAQVDALVLPGGESSTMIKLAQRRGLWNTLEDFVQTKPCWGICAGAILLARQVSNPCQPSLSAIDVLAHRNAYGSQRESFRYPVRLDATADEIVGDFIRAPQLRPLSDTPRPIAFQRDEAVGFAQNRCMVTAFHTELSSDARLHARFLAFAAAR